MAVPVSRLLLQTDDQGVFSVLGENDFRVTRTDLEKSRGEIAVKGITLSLNQTTHFLSMGSAETVLHLEASGWHGFVVTIPKNNQVALGLDTMHSLIDLSAVASNTSIINVHLADGGRAELRAAAVCRYDQFRDGSYCFSGRGPVRGFNADGQIFDWSSASPPMLGGPLQVVDDGQGGQRMKRVQPATSVKISSQETGKIKLQIGAQTVSLVTGQTQKISLPNGTAFQFTLDSATRTFNWSVDKGHCAFGVEGFPAWKAIGLTGQSCVLMWDASRRTIDIRNRSPETPMLIALPQMKFAVVDPQAVFHYVQPEDGLSERRAGKLIFYEMAGESKADNFAFMPMQRSLSKQGEVPLPFGRQNTQLDTPRIFQPPATGF